MGEPDSGKFLDPHSRESSAADCICLAAGMRLDNREVPPLLLVNLSPHNFANCPKWDSAGGLSASSMSNSSLSNSDIVLARTWATVGGHQECRNPFSNTLMSLGCHCADSGPSAPAEL